LHSVRNPALIVITTFLSTLRNRILADMWPEKQDASQHFVSFCFAATLTRNFFFWEPYDLYLHFTLHDDWGTAPWFVLHVMLLFIYTCRQHFLLLPFLSFCFWSLIMCSVRYIKTTK